MGRRRKYNTEEERKAAMKAYWAEYYQKNKEKIDAYQAEYRANNREKIAEYKANHKEERAEYYQNNKEKFAAYQAEYRANHKEEMAEYYQNNKEKMVAYQAEYRANHKEELAAKHAEYRSTPFGRAKYLEFNYKRLDEESNRGECIIDAQWILDNIFTQSCHYCGETDWMKLGCDRINNSLPHTPDNVVCCCGKCNIKKQKTPYEEFMRKIGKVA